MILQRPSDNFGGRSRAGIDQHDDGQTLGNIAAEDRFRIVGNVFAPRPAALGDDTAVAEEEVG